MTDTILAVVDFTQDSVTSTAGANTLIGEPPIQFGYQFGDIVIVPNVLWGSPQPGEFWLSSGSYFMPINQSNAAQTNICEINLFARRQLLDRHSRKQ